MTNFRDAHDANCKQNVYAETLGYKYKKGNIDTRTLDDALWNMIFLITFVELVFGLVKNCY